MHNESCKYIEECFRNIKYGKDKNRALVTISNTIKRELGKEVTIEIIHNTSGEFFGMNIYPAPDELVRIAQRLYKDTTPTQITENWKEINKWCIEIDDLLFNDINLDVQPDELTALLLHELGHVVLSDEVPKSTLKSFKINFYKREISFKNIFNSDSPIPSDVHSLVLTFPIIEACSNKGFFKSGYGRGVDLKREFIADEYVQKCGYGGALYNFIEKLIAYGENDMINKTNAEKENEIGIITNWAFDNLHSLVKRKGKLYKALKVEMKRNPSNLVKTICNRLNDKLFKETPTDFTNTNTLIMESYVVNGLNKAINNFNRFVDKHNRVKPCKVRELDVFEVEIANINTVDDKMYIIESLHDELDRVEYALMLIEQGHVDRVTQSKTTLQQYRDNVVKLLHDAKIAKIPEEKYGLFIKYPKGYEG